MNELKLDDCGIAIQATCTADQNVDHVVTSVLDSVLQADQCGICHIVVAITRSDYTERLARILTEELAHFESVSILSDVTGYSDNILDDAMMLFFLKRKRIAFVVSSELASMIVPANVLNTLAAFSTPETPHGKRARIGGLLLPPARLYRKIAAGRVSNLFSAWDVRALCPGIFGPPGPGEEIRPIARVTNERGKCIALIPCETVDHDALARCESYLPRTSDSEVRERIAASVGGSSLTKISMSTLPGGVPETPPPGPQRLLK